MFGFVEKIKFDVNNNFLVGFGGLKFFVLDLRTKSFEKKECIKVYEITDALYTKIYNLNFCSCAKLNKEIYKNLVDAGANFISKDDINEEDDKQQLKCFVAVQRYEKKEIHVFDYF